MPTPPPIIIKKGRVRKALKNGGRVAGAKTQATRGGARHVCGQGRKTVLSGAHAQSTTHPRAPGAGHPRPPRIKYTGGKSVVFFLRVGVGWGSLLAL